MAIINPMLITPNNTGQGFDGAAAIFYLYFIGM